MITMICPPPCLDWFWRVRNTRNVEKHVAIFVSSSGTVKSNSFLGNTARNLYCK